MRKIKDMLKHDKLFNGYRKFYTSILLSFIISLILPVLISGIILYVSLYHSAKMDFYKTHEKQLKEITSYIWQTTNNIETDLASLKTDTAFRKYRKLVNNEVKTSVSEYQHIANSLLSITSKYAFLYSIYFYDKDFGTIYNTDYGSSTWINFQDTDWIGEISNISRVQRLKPRINMNQTYLKDLKPYSFQLYKPQKVLSLVCQANTTKMFVANISIADLYNELVNLYSLNQDGCMLYIINDSNRIQYTQDTSYINAVFPVDLAKQQNSAFTNKNNVYFTSSFYDGMLYCVLSYPIGIMNTATNYFADYVILICISLFIFLLILARIVALKLYHPIDDLCKNIQNTFSESVDSKMNIKDEITVLKETFQSLNANNSSMNYILSSYETIVRNHNLKLYFEGSLSYEDLVDGNRIPYINIDKSYYNQLILFRLPKKFVVSRSVHEMSLLHNKIKDVMNTYIKNAPNGFFIYLQQDTFLAFISIKNYNSLTQLKEILFTTMEELLDEHVFCVESNYIRTSDELLPSCQECINAMKHAVYFNRIGSVLSVAGMIKNYEFSYDFLVNTEAGLIRNILLYNLEECIGIIKDVTLKIRNTPDISYAIDIWTQILAILNKNMYLEDILNIHVSAGIRQLDTLSETEEFMIDLCNRTVDYYISHSQTEGQYCTDAKKFIEENYMKDFSITDVADSLNISYQYLSKIFKTQCGRSMCDYLNYIRIEKGKEYLRNTNESFAKIAQKIGYNNVQSFQRFFKKYENVTPYNYRKLNMIR